MADIKKEDVIEWLSNQSVLEIAGLVKDLEEKWGVSAAAPVAAVAAVAGGGGEAAAEEEKTEFDVILKGHGSNKIAAAERELNVNQDYLVGPTAIVVGGDNAPGVAKALEKFFKDKKKLEVKGGLLENDSITTDQISDLAKLPPADVLKAQLLGLLNQPASQMVRIIQAVPQGMLNVLQAKADQGE